MQARENLRQAYLNAMGIQTWFPRRVLPNALAARTFDWLDEAEPVSADQDAPASAAKVSAVKSSSSPDEPAQAVHSKDILKHVVAEHPRIASTPAPFIAPDKELDNTLAVEMKTFRLVVISLGPDHLVVADMPYVAQNQYTRYHHRLLQDMIRAIKLPPPSTEPVREFAWPLTHNSSHHSLLTQINQSPQAAGEAVRAFLTKQYHLLDRKVVLLLGQAAAYYIFDQTRSFEKLRGIHSNNDTKPIFAITHGLNELMNVAALKSEAWLDIRSLVLLDTH